MKFNKRTKTGFAKGDMTPMIDMTFQLIAFFMVLLNFTDAEQNQKIRLPSSELAKPPEVPVDLSLTLQLTNEGTVIMGPEEVSLADLHPNLVREKQLMERDGKSASQATIIIRADRRAKTGRVQEVIETCQKTGFEKFALRAKQKRRLAKGT